MRPRTVKFLTLSWAALCVLLYVGLRPWGAFEAWERAAEDRLLRNGLKPTIDERIVLIEIDTAALRDPRLGKPPWRPANYAPLVRRLNELGARQIALDILLEHVYDEADLKLAEAIRHSRADIVLASQWTVDRHEDAREVRWTLPAREFRRAKSADAKSSGLKSSGLKSSGLKSRETGGGKLACGFINLPIDRGLVRYCWPRRPHPFDEERSVDSFACALARNLGVDVDAAPKKSTARGDFPSAAGDEGICRIHFVGPAGSFPRLNVQQLMGWTEGAALDSIRGATVLVGVTALEYHDLHDTPMNRMARDRVRRMPGIEIHANALNMFLSGGGERTLRRAHWPAVLLVVLLATVPFVWIVLHSRPLVSFAALPIWLFIGYAATQEVFDRWRLMTPFWGPALLLVALWLGGVAIRWAIVDRQKYRLRQLLGRCLNDSVVARLESQSLKDSMSGARRTVTVFFCDIRGFTKLSERLPPEEVVERLREYFAAMGEVIYEHQGAVDKYIGDAIMAFFGTPQDDPHHARRAVLCALAMLERLQTLNEGWAARGLQTLEIGFGVSTGSVIAGMLGSERKMEYTVIGDAVNVASRLESLNKEHGTRVLISGQTRQALGPGFDVEDRGVTTIRGKTMSVRVYAVNGLLSERADALDQEATRGEEESNETIGEDPSNMEPIGCASAQGEKS